MAGKMLFQSYKIQENCSWHRLYPMRFQAFDVLVQSNITFGIDKKIHPSEYYNVTTTAFMAFFNKKTNIL